MKKSSIIQGGICVIEFQETAGIVNGNNDGHVVLVIVGIQQ